MKLIATWIREVDEAHFVKVFQNYPQVALQNARRAPVLMADAQALLLTGGSDISLDFLRQPVPNPEIIEDANPPRDLWEFAALAEAMTRRLPILAICRGLQVLNVALGGTLHLHIPSHDSHKYENTQKLKFAPHASAQINAVNSSHHQALAQLGAGLEIEAWAAEDEIVEQARLRDYPFALGVQYHPERDPLYRPLFDLFVQQIV